MRLLVFTGTRTTYSVLVYAALSYSYSPSVRGLKLLIFTGTRTTYSVPAQIPRGAPRQTLGPTTPSVTHTRTRSHSTLQTTNSCKTNPSTVLTPTFLSTTGVYVYLHCKCVCVVCVCKTNPSTVRTPTFLSTTGVYVYLHYWCVCVCVYKTNPSTVRTPTFLNTAGA
jgi:hypothetical protein